MPIHAFGWLVLLLLPMAAFFSALALAVAALARSTKEGQYYLMPLLLVTLPLVALPMLPSLELNLGTSLVPVSGAVFLVRSLIEGRYTEAVIHLPVVMLVTACCCSLAIRWAIRQFESEAVMFREADRWSVKLWLHQLWRDRGETASPTEAILCGMIILIGMFFAQFVAGSSVSDWNSIVTSTVVVQIGLILTPCLLMAIFLTRSLRHALRIHRTQPGHVAAAVLIGISMHPSYLALGKGISQVYKIGDETATVLQYFQSLILAQPLWSLLLLMALLPAVCEELAFRGFIFGGLLRQGGALRAIVVSALFFGFTHPVLQQSMAAALMGLLLGLIAWRTGGVLCTIIVHAINNSLSLSLAWCAANQKTLPVALQWVISNEGDEWAYQPEWIALSVFMSLALLVVLFRRNAVTRQTVQAEMA
jgi:sodium transport system permease protein